jgi:murein DD-endopeptidase MepM/ murein hydrolase activator NlpD
MRNFRLWLLFICFAFTFTEVKSQSGRIGILTTESSSKRTRVWINPSRTWTDSGIRVSRGDLIKITAQGTVLWCPPCRNEMTPTVGPKGTRQPYDPDKHRFPLPNAGCGALIMRIANQIVAVGESALFLASNDGPLEFMVNDDDLSDNRGAFTLLVESARNTFRRPIDGGSEACAFDTKKCADPKKYHSGIDYWGTGNRTSDILASNCARVSTIQKNDGKTDHGLGNAVILEHQVFNSNNPYGVALYSLYAHMDSIEPNLWIGRFVKKGERLGLMGSSGYGRADAWGKTPHLHFELKTDDTLKNPVGLGQHWGYTPTSATNFGYMNPSFAIENWQVDCWQYDPPDESTNDFWEGGVDSRSGWQRTGVFVEKGELIRVAAFGTVTWDPQIQKSMGVVGPSGTLSASLIAKRPFAFPAPNFRAGSLIGRINRQIFYLGENAEIRSVEKGELELMINDDFLNDNSGFFQVIAQIARID